MVLQKSLKTVLYYEDCRCSDVRLVLALLLNAHERGANIASYRELKELTSLENEYRTTLHKIVALRNGFNARYQRDNVKRQNDQYKEVKSEHGIGNSPFKQA